MVRSLIAVSIESGAYASRENTQRSNDGQALLLRGLVQAQRAAPEVATLASNASIASQAAATPSSARTLAPTAAARVA